jgi:hypothetical protein
VSRTAIERIARAVLYEGYLLYPYRATSLKNRRRLGIGALLPRGSDGASAGSSALDCQCLVRGRRDGRLRISVRFLQLFERVDGSGSEPWHEGVEREVTLPERGLDALLAEPARVDARFGPTLESAGALQGAALSCAVEASMTSVETDVYLLELHVENTTPPGDASAGAEIRSLASAHALLEVSGAEFVSLLEPPEALVDHAARCQNRGAWPVLVGDRLRRDALLVSPIILYDFPEVAPESPGDLFDATEIDEILTLRILTLTDAEKQAMRAADPRARALLERTEALSTDDLMLLHGTLRSREPLTSPADFDLYAERPARWTHAGTDFVPGMQVRLAPSRRADVFDIALAGRSATIRSIEQDFEGRVLFGVTIDDDPGSDLGAAAFPAHRFFFGPDEVELP